MQIGLRGRALDHAQPPQRRGPPVAGDAGRVAEAGPKIVQQQVAVGRDGLRSAVRRGDGEARPVAGAAAGIREHGGAGGDERAIGLVPWRRRPSANEGIDERQQRWRDLCLAGRRIGAMRRRHAGCLAGRAIAPGRRVQRRRQPKVQAEGERNLVVDRGGIRLPAEAADAVRLSGAGGGTTGMAGAAASLLLGGAGEDRGGIDPLEQPGPGQRRRHARREQGGRVERAIAGVDEPIGRLSQAHRAAIGQGHRDLLPGDLDPAFGRQAVNAGGLELRAIGRIGPVRSGKLEEDRRRHRLARRIGRQPAGRAMAGGAGAGVVERAEAVGGSRRGRRRHPGALEQGMAEGGIEAGLATGRGQRAGHGRHHGQRRRGGDPAAGPPPRRCRLRQHGHSPSSRCPGAR